MVNKLYNSTVDIVHDFGTITIPISEFIDKEDLQDIVEDNLNMRDLMWEIQDLAYEYFTSTLKVEVNGL